MEVKSGMHEPVRIGCAGWSISRADAASFPRIGHHLERYSTRFNCVEINSSFYRAHRPSTYARWAASVPPAFRFAVKMPRAITHDLRLVGVGSLLDAFFAEAGALGEKLGCVLVQLPPSFCFERARVARFLAMLRRRHIGDVALEARHASWFGPPATALMVEHGIARVAADPAVVPDAALPGGNGRMAYFRLHGSPRMYYSSYEKKYLTSLADELRTIAAAGARVWCIFDNTALGAATPNALEIERLLRQSPGTVATEKRRMSSMVR